MKLSVAIITFNEDRILEQTLQSINDIADEIIIIDSFSTDKTQEICEKYPKVNFIQKKFEGFGKQKNYAIEHCNSTWILFLDADEIPNQKAITSIQEIVSSPSPSFSVYNIKFNNIFLGKTLKYGGWGNVKRERLFKKGQNKYSEDIVHEEFITKEIKGLLNGEINHYTYKDIFHHIEKSNKYSSLMAEKMYKRGKKPSLFKIVINPRFQFFKSYILRLGFLDGIVGYYAAKTTAFYTLLKYYKLYEKHQIK